MSTEITNSTYFEVVTSGASFPYNLVRRDQGCRSIIPREKATFVVRRRFDNATVTFDQWPAGVRIPCVATEIVSSNADLLVLW